MAPPTGPALPRRYARNLTTWDASVTSAASSTPATGAAVPPTGRGTASARPTPQPHISQHRLATPLRPLELQRELALHPDKAFVSELLANLTHGCNIGYEGPQFPLTAPHLPTALSHPHVIDKALREECVAGRMAGPYSHPPLPNLRCSSLGVVPKKDGGWRVIYHLSAPTGRSINDFINPARFSLHYCTTDAAIAIINTLGKTTLMGKLS